MVDELEKQSQYENETFVTPYLRISGNRMSTKGDTVNYKKFNKAYKMLDEDYTLYYYSWIVSAKIFESFNKYILECHQHGIISHLNEKYFPKAVQPDEDGPQILTMYILSAGFYLWLGTVFVACLVFIGEHVVRYFSKRRREFRKNRKNFVTYYF